MDNNDIIIKNKLTSFNDESVPFGFNDKVMAKIEAESLARESRRESLRNYITLVVVASVFSGALLLINHYFFKINLNFKIDISGIAQKMQDISSIYLSRESFIWIGIGVNIVLLLLFERIISEKLRKKEAGES